MYSCRLKFIGPNWVMLKDIIDIGLKHNEQKVRDSALDLLNSITKGVFDLNMNNRYIKTAKFGQKFTNPSEIIKLTIENDYEGYKRVLDDVVLHYIYPNIYNITDNLILKSIYIEYIISLFFLSFFFLFSSSLFHFF